MSDIADRYRIHADIFERKVAAVRPDRWSHQSLCENWNARDVGKTALTGPDDTMDPADADRLWSATTALPGELLEKFRTPGAVGPGVEVCGPEVEVSADAPLQDRLLGLVGRDPRWVRGGSRT